jgi:pyruvate/2-oxoglutarate dehydrogenase complex dihydrolipoamide acyltransferase (E2) component
MLNYLTMKKTKPLFRKIAIALWEEAGDPTVYGFVEVDVTTLTSTRTPLAAIVKALGETMALNPELHSMIKWGKVIHRSDKAISVMVNMPEQKKDLSAITIQDVEQLSLAEIEMKIQNKAELVRKQNDPHLGPMLVIIKHIPRFFLKWFLKVYSFMIYELETRLGITVVPFRPFGSIIVSNIGSLGLKKALLPLVPLARASLMVSVGAVSEEVRAVDGKICIRKIVHLGISFDHRLFDGAHAGKMLADFENAFKRLSLV